VVFGGVKINPQMQKLRGGVDILVATPGRLLDLYSQNAVKFDQLFRFINRVNPLFNRFYGGVSWRY
jgi:ATP-dependent RNA helicase RhlE